LRFHRPQERLPARYASARHNNIVFSQIVALG